MGKIRFIIILLAVTCSGTFFFNCDLVKMKPDIKKAQEAEITGRIPEALAIYSDLLLAATPVLTIPDNNKSKFLKPEQWQKEVENYLVWVQTAQPTTGDDYQQALNGTLSCTREENVSNRMLRLKSVEVNTDTFQSVWNYTFFASIAKIDPAHKQLSSAAFIKNLSFIKLSSPKSFTYTIQLINLSTKRRIEATLPPETNVALMAIPGEYLILIRSSVMFESNKMWLSPYDAVKITVPEKPSLITASLITKVAR
jgi:hypothetical protein